MSDLYWLSALIYIVTFFLLHNKIYKKTETSVYWSPVSHLHSLGIWVEVARTSNSYTTPPPLTTSDSSVLVMPRGAPC